MRDAVVGRHNNGESNEEVKGSETSERRDGAVLMM
jgi:hypothetical protein